MPSVPLRQTDPRARPRERLTRLGPEALTDAELVALLLGSGTPGANVVDLAQRLLDGHGGVDGLAAADVPALAHEPGMGQAKAARLVGAFALGRRRGLADDGRRVVRTSQDVVDLAAPLLVDLRRERVVAVVCDARRRVLAAVVVAEGGAHLAAFSVRDVLAEVLRRDGSALALAHQHPGGDPTPSPADLEATARLTAAAAHCGVRLLDHVVLGDGRWRSAMPLAGPTLARPPARRGD